MINYPGEFFTITPIADNRMLPDSKYLMRIENAAINALSDYVEFG